MQAAIGVSQLAKLDRFVAARRHNFAIFTELLADLDDVLVLPRATPGSEPSWFGYPLTVRPGAGNRNDLVRHLERRNVATRLLFGGNLTRQPAFLGHPERRPFALTGADEIMRSTFWVGLFPGLTEEHLGYVSDRLHEWFERRTA
jgi:CDP-6-deoxy-D-xylo-4-hexulose-3-dehydrase